ncbi:hypothetical protein IPH19_01125 [Candidatus Uhrbacteria bacterium]|nr:MAG: hypothetical protein IPH19_01125 [Candidatus Uhrbacteria bacterium]
MSEYRLITELLKLSQSQKWAEAQQEWDLDNVVRADEPETCMCGHFPIIEICLIRNIKTSSVARVGNCCVKKFIDKSDKIFRSIAKVKKDIDKSFNKETIEFAYNKSWINQWERDFYFDIQRKRVLSDKQTKKKVALNQKIVNKLSKQG